jgi:predicted RNase H-like HicB family nuclease
VARVIAKQAGWLDWLEVLMARYVALVDGRSGSYGLTVPDLPGCTSAAATIDEVLRRATEAVRLWAEDALADGEKLPKPRSIEAVRADPEVAAALAHGAVLAIVPLVRDAGRPVKANLSLDAGLLAAIDEAAAARGLTRSAFLASAAREKIETERWSHRDLLRRDHACHSLCDEVKRNLERVRNSLQGRDRSLPPSAFQIGNITLSDVSLLRDIKLRFTAPLANYAQCIFASANSVNN